jgi:hypothetical protein
MSSSSFLTGKFDEGKEAETDVGQYPRKLSLFSTIMDTVTLSGGPSTGKEGGEEPKLVEEQHQGLLLYLLSWTQSLFHILIWGGDK